MKHMTKVQAIMVMWNFIMIVLLAAAAQAAGVNAISLSVDKPIVVPGENLMVTFSVSPALPENAWIGIIPSGIAHGSEALNDQHDLTYQYIGKRTSGTMTFKSPASAGSYDFRFHDTDGNGVELAFVTFSVGKEAPATPPVPAVSMTGGVNLRLDKYAVSPGEQIRVYFTTPSGYAQNAWIGIIPSHIQHGSEAVNDQHDMTYQYLSGRTSGEMVFSAPSKSGLYDFRLHDTDNNGRETAYVTFTVN